MRYNVTNLPLKRMEKRKDELSFAEAKKLIKLSREDNQEIHDGAYAIIAANLVSEMRQNAGFTQSALGKKLGWPQQRISVLESGSAKKGMSIGTLCTIAEACGGRLDIRFVPDQAKDTLNEKVFVIGSK